MPFSLLAGLYKKVKSGKSYHHLEPLGLSLNGRPFSITCGHFTDKFLFSLRSRYYFWKAIFWSYLFLKVVVPHFRLGSTGVKVLFEEQRLFQCDIKMKLIFRFNVLELQVHKLDEFTTMWSLAIYWEVMVLVIKRGKGVEVIWLLIM